MSVSNIRILGSSSVVRQDDPLYSMLVRQHRILHALNSLNYEWEVCKLSDPCNRIPVEVR
jgi:hypothetical protein